jgi:aldehyde dehydrogenase (NAD+)
MNSHYVAKCYVDGQWIDAVGESFDTVSPATGALLAQTRAADEELASRAIAGAREKFEGHSWSRSPGRDRGRLLATLADLLERDRETVAELAATEIGTPISAGRGLHVDVPVSILRWFAEAADRGPVGGYEQQMPMAYSPQLAGSMLLREPIGVVGAIVAFNVPIMMAAFKLGGALAAGCTVVLTTSPKAALLTTKFVELVEEAGFPANTVNFVFGDPRINVQMCTDPRVDMITFTGSPAVGASLAGAAAPLFKKMVLELGGKSPNLVLPGAELSDALIAGTALRFTRNTGQACGATTRLIVPRPLLDEFVEKSTRFLESLPLGDPLDEATVLGPLITTDHRDKVEGYIDRARIEGAATPCGGQRPAGVDRGAFLSPTLVTGVSNNSEISRDELFAPVAVVLPYDEVADALSMANDTPFHLNANVWGPTDQAIEVARTIRSGTVTINGGSGMRADAPWGGPGDSGIGREGGEEGFREFFELKHVQWVLG